MADWSRRVEDLVDDGDRQGAIKLLEQLVEKLELEDGSKSNLTLAAAMGDLAKFYDQDGLSLKADALRRSAIVIKSNAASSVSGSGQTSNRGTLEREETGDNGNEECVEDWEKADDVLPPSSSKPSSPIAPLSNSEKVSKQRGRGTFTFGNSGLYSDYDLRDYRQNGSVDDEVEEDSNKDTVLYGASHVLVIKGFSPKVTTRDLEQLVQEYSDRGVVIRWVNDTTALAVFRNPTLARDALVSIKLPPGYTLQSFDDCPEIHGTVSQKDFVPPAPRPATSARAAQRMIMGALQQQGVLQQRLQKSKFTAEELRLQEKERKQRLLIREKLRQEAWGD